MKIAAFDLGSTYAMAWNWVRSSDPVGVVHQDLNPDRAKPKLRLERPAVLHAFNQSVSAYMLRVADVVVYERPFARGQAATRLLWGMAGVLEAKATEAGVPILDITPAEIKKWATGSGKADKTAMLDAANLLGYTGSNEHEADAWCLLKFAEATLILEKT